MLRFLSALTVIATAVSCTAIVGDVPLPDGTTGSTSNATTSTGQQCAPRGGDCMPDDCCPGLICDPGTTVCIECRGEGKLCKFNMDCCEGTCDGSVCRSHGTTSTGGHGGKGMGGSGGGGTGGTSNTGGGVGTAGFSSTASLMSSSASLGTGSTGGAFPVGVATSTTTGSSMGMICGGPANFLVSQNCNSCLESQNCCGGFSANCPGGNCSAYTSDYKKCTTAHPQQCENDLSAFSDFQCACSNGCEQACHWQSGCDAISISSGATATSASAVGSSGTGDARAPGEGGIGGAKR